MMIENSSVFLSRFVLLGLLGLTYTFAFSLTRPHVKPLLSKSGLTPAADYLKRLKQTSHPNSKQRTMEATCRR